jgi:hypothetical protein
MHNEFKTLRVLDVSTSHITQEDDEKLSEGVMHLVYHTLEYGYLVSTYEPSEEEWVDVLVNSDGLSKELVNLIVYAGKHNYDYVMLDRDGTLYEGLPTFDW